MFFAACGLVVFGLIAWHLALSQEERYAVLRTIRRLSFQDS